MGIAFKAMKKGKAMSAPKGKALVEICGAPRKSDGKPCEQPPGMGTGHVGIGPCKFHGGCLPNVEQHYQGREAINFAVGALGAEVAMDPLDAILQSVRLASGMVDHYRHRLANLAEGEDAVPPTRGLIEAYRDQNRFAKAALDAGVDARLVAIAERVGDTVVAAIEEALAELPNVLDAATRTLLAQAVERALAKREPPTIEGTARELDAGD